MAVLLLVVDALLRLAFLQACLICQGIAGLAAAGKPARF
jgi:hypothetical protein